MKLEINLKTNKTNKSSFLKEARQGAEEVGQQTPIKVEGIRGRAGFSVYIFLCHFDFEAYKYVTWSKKKKKRFTENIFCLTRAC